MAELEDDDEYMMGGGTRGVVVSGAPVLKPVLAGEIMQPEGLQVPRRLSSARMTFV